MWLVVCVVFYFCCSADGGFGKFVLTLDNLTECANPQPPFPKVRKVILENEIHVRKGKSYLSGRSLVLAEVPFKNLSMSTFAIDNFGRQELKFQVNKLNCRSLIGRSFLVSGNMHFSKKNCMMLRGRASYKDVDIDKIAHSIPAWHSEGSLLSRVQVADNKNTIFCFQLNMMVKSVK